MRKTFKEIKKNHFAIQQQSTLIREYTMNYHFLKTVESLIVQEKNLF